MTSATDQITTVAVVTIGQFNPSIAHPQWLASEGLISKAEAEGAKVEVIHPDFALFALTQQGAPVLHVQLLRDRLHLSTEDARFYETARDLSIGILTLLRHTRVTKLGLNYDSHVPMKDDEARNALGRRLAPVEPWKGVVDEPALLGLSMKGRRPDAHAGHVMIRVEPSARAPHGVLVAVNDHYDIDPTSTAENTADRAVELLKQSWDASFKRAREIVARVTG